MVVVSGPSGLLVTGVYGVGKTTLVEEIASSLERRDLPFAAIDLDWLSWFRAPNAETERQVPLDNLTDVVER